MAKETFVFSLILLLCCLAFASALSKKTIETDESALLALKSHITLDSNSTLLLSNWTEETSCCTWIGVECSLLRDRVVALNFSNLGLRGTIPPQIGNLSFLSSIDIRYNNFEGELAPEMSELKRLKYIDFGFNNISGKIPSWFGSLPDLQILNLRNNHFSGSLPSSIFNATKLQFLGLSDNQLNGYIPDEIGNLGNLRYLNLAYNQVEGSVPLSISNLSSLEVMSFSSNRMIGDLPMSICSSVPKLERILLSDNHFSGKIQSRFDNCSKLQILSLSINNFTGSIPREIGNLTKLVELYFGRNEFQGEIHPALGSLFNLEVLHIGYCHFFGKVPSEVGNLQRLSKLNLFSNSFSGPIPPSIFNISSLSSLILTLNNFTGSLPPHTGRNLPNLETLALGSNKLSGVLPSSVSNLTKLTFLDFSLNQFTGSVPASLGNLRSLQRLILFNNFLSTTGFDFLASLTNSRSLIEISIHRNPFNMSLPATIGNFSNSLQLFDAKLCGIRGNIPQEIGNLGGLITLDLGINALTGELPLTLQNLSNLQALGLDSNRITGFLPNILCNMRQLSLLILGGNQLNGKIPECFGSMTNLRHLYLEKNGLNSTLPAELGNLVDLLVIDVRSNFLSGNITPAIGGLKAALSINLSKNNFSGIIPATIGGLGNLINLSFAHNQLQGPIPEPFRKLVSLEILDLSYNNLTGEIYAAFETLSELKYLDVSFNHLRGRIPTNGSFMKFGIESFVSNYEFCGGAQNLHFPPCIDDPPQGSKRNKLQIVAYTLIPTAALVALMSGIFFVFLRKQKKPQTPFQLNLAPTSMLERVSYYEIQRATGGFNETNVLGKGGFGTVYKGVLRDGTTLAIKVFNLQLVEAFKSFETECEVLGSIRHRNLVKVISCCSNLDFKAIVLEYMLNGSLEKWLYSHNHFLDSLQRLNIMIDVATALDYLHHGYTSQIVHCDLKPSNILLDEQLVGHVSDFGISKLLGGGENMVQTMTVATIGYTAPEYGSEGRVSTSCDVYSFGILLMETFSRRKPTDDIFAEGWGLRETIEDGLKNSNTDFIDQNMLYPDDQRSGEVVKSITCIMELALRCTVDSPEQRNDVTEVLVELKNIRLLFVSNLNGGE